MKNPVPKKLENEMQEVFAAIATLRAFHGYEQQTQLSEYTFDDADVKYKLDELYSSLYIAYRDHIGELALEQITE